MAISRDQLRGVLTRIWAASAPDETDPTGAPTLGTGPVPPIPGPIDASIVRETVSDIVIPAFDPEHAGFGTAPKFPHPHALALAIEQYVFTRSAELGAVVSRSLDAMGWRGMYDAVEGGFFRCADGRDWSAPRSEKRLEDNRRSGLS